VSRLLPAAVQLKKPMQDEVEDTGMRMCSGNKTMILQNLCNTRKMHRVARISVQYQKDAINVFTVYDILKLLPKESLSIRFDCDPVTQHTTLSPQGLIVRPR